MDKKITVVIENNLLRERRDMTIYHHATKSAHMISHGNSIPIRLEPVEENDYLHISIVSGPGSLENHTIIKLPAWLNYEFSSPGSLMVSHSGDRTLLKIPPGLPTWQLKITRSQSSTTHHSTDMIIIGDT